MEASMADFVTLPGGGGNFTSIAVPHDAKAALTTAIKNLFNAAGSNITANEIASGVSGMKGFFNVVLDGALAATTVSAGTNVQALIDTGLGKDTLLGNASTTLFVGNGAGDSISSMATSTIIGGAGDDTVSVVGNATAYLEGGNNQVQLKGGSLNLLGTGGSDTVSVVTGSNTVSVAYKATVALSGSGTTDQLNLATGSTVDVSGNNISATIGGNNDTIVFTGSNEHVMLTGTGDTIIISGGNNDTITYSTGGGGSSKHGATAIGGGHSGHGPKGHGPHSDDPKGATLHGGAAAFTHTIGATSVYTAGAQSGTLIGALGDTTGAGDLFKFDAKTHSHHTIAAFSSSQDTISLLHADRTQIADALRHATITGGGTHTTTLFALDNTKITIIGDRVLSSDLKTSH
jgi:hypothetical protein